MSELTLPPFVYSIEETQRLLGGVSRWTIGRLLRNGELTQRRIGARSMVTRASIEAFVRRRDHVTKPRPNNQPSPRECNSPRKRGSR
jgi:hypothetical protein